MTNEEYILRALEGERPIAFRPIYARIMGSCQGGVALSQMVYWGCRMNREFYKTDEDIREECFLGRDAWATIKKQLKEMGIFSIEVKGLPAKTYYTLNPQALFIKIQEFQKKEEIPDNGEQEVVKTAQLDTQTPGKHTIPETTTETTLPSEEKLTFEEFMESKGCELRELTNNDGEVQDCWFRNDRMVSSGNLSSLTSEFSRLYGTPRIIPIPLKKRTDPIQIVFALFTENPARGSWLKIPAQRDAAKSLHEQFKYEEIVTMNQKAKRIKIDPYAPQVDSPYALLTKWQKIKEYKEEFKEVWPKFVP